ncbi:MAG: transposase [Nitrosomonas sp.]|jgi:hypothetical protein|nr:transposase [Nitrosomonas sp.]
MQGKQTCQQELFSTIDLESIIPKDPLLRKVDKLLDLEFLYDLTEELYYVDNGRTSIYPVLFFRMQLISYLFGIESDRQLCRDVHLNLAYRWFCRIPLYHSVPHRKRAHLYALTFFAIDECGGKLDFSATPKPLSLWRKHEPLPPLKIKSTPTPGVSKMFDMTRPPCTFLYSHTMGRPLHNHENLAVVTEKNFQMMLIARHFGRK